LNADPDPDPATQINADPCGSGSGYGSGSETLLHNIKKLKYKYIMIRERAPEEVDGWAAGPAGHPQHLPHRASLPTGNTLKKLMPRKVYSVLETFDAHEQTL
jgi:hypothetical protein